MQIVAMADGARPKARPRQIRVDMRHKNMAPDYGPISIDLRPVILPKGQGRVFRCSVECPGARRALKFTADGRTPTAALSKAMVGLRRRRRIGHRFIVTGYTLCAGHVPKGRAYNAA